jgi:RNA polymerase sigma-70 factor (ECF subfamily)
VPADARSLEGAEISFATAEIAPVGGLCMGEAEFRAFYEKTVRPLRGYFHRVSGNAALADDLLQESYLRLLRAPLAEASQEHRKHYLFRIATNLLRDHFRAYRPSSEVSPEIAASAGEAARFETQRDLGQFLLELEPRERELLWMAYVEGYRHDEIAKFLHCRAASVRPMLFRARQRLAELLRSRGWARNSREEGKP